jgi:antitoxin component of MazEF toxin-antitoxin module
MPMSSRLEGTVKKAGTSLRIDIPQEIAELLYLQKGDSVDLWVDNQIMLMEKKNFAYDAIWGFAEDILEERKKLSKDIEAHLSQSIGGIPLHKYKGQLTIERQKIVLKGKNNDSNEPAVFVFPLEQIESVYLGWDETLRRWKDTRALFRPLRITLKGETISKKLYLYLRKTGAYYYGEENNKIFKVLKNSLPSDNQ